MFFCVSQCSTASTRRVKSHGRSWPHPSTTGQSPSQWGCVSCSKWRASRPSWSTWSPSFPKAKFPWSPGWISILSIIYFTTFVGILLLFVSWFYFHFSGKCCFLHCLYKMCFIKKELQKQIQNHLTDLSLFCVCQVWCCHCRCGPPIFCCRGSQFNGQGGTQSPAVHVEPAYVPVLSDSDNDLPHHTLPSRPRPS